MAVLGGLRGLEDGGSAAIGLLAAPVVLVAFVLFELRSRDPAVDPRLFRRRAYTGAVLGVFGATVILHGTLVLVPLLVQEVQGGDARTSGFVLLGISALGAVAAPYGGRMSDVVGRRRPVLIGSLVSVLGLFLMWGFAAGSITIVLGALLALVGFGLGIAGSPRTTAALETIEPERVGMAAGTYLTGRYIGGALGATLAGAVLGGNGDWSGRDTGLRAAHPGRRGSRRCVAPVAGSGHRREDRPRNASRSHPRPQPPRRIRGAVADPRPRGLTPNSTRMRSSPDANGRRWTGRGVRRIVPA